ncbi:hypothetical protein [Marinovum sp.]|uniref:hypothetical protein n=1 Tax=Marinovum sp. TaxID=2024839 RepID=UPI003A9449B6
MKPSIERLENALIIMARMITTRADGETYLPICERLEAEIAALRASENYMDKMRRLAECGAARGAASQA